MRNNSIGKSGEFFVAGELERRGFNVSILFGNEEFYDLLAVSAKGKVISIQVKTTLTKRNYWTLNENKIRNEDNFYYIFVSLNNYASPTYHIVEGKTVYDYVTTHGTQWKTSIKRFSDSQRKYVNNWDSLLD